MTVRLRRRSRNPVSIVVAMLWGICASVCLHAGVALGQDSDGAAPAEVAGDRYERDLARWRQVMIDGFELRNQFNICEEREAADLRKRWHEKIAEGDEILRELRATALEKYQQLAKPDKDIGEFIIAMSNKDVTDQQYERAAPAFNTVFASGLTLDDTDLNGAGIASFCTNDFERAQQYLHRADELNVLQQAPMGRGMLSRIDEMKTAWNREQLLRQLESINDDLPQVRLVTSQGEIVAELFENDAPNTVGNFIALAEKGFFDGQYFFAINDHIASTGCPQGNGKGGPGYRIENEVTSEKYRAHFRGALTMINDDQGRLGSRFSICKLPMPTLNAKATCFGRVISGIESLGMLQGPGEKTTEEEIGKLLRVEVIRKRDHEYQPAKVE